MGFKEDLAAAKVAAAEDRVVTPHIPVVINDHMYTLIFMRASTTDWSTATIKHPPREGVAIDARNGYNLSAATREIAPKYGRIVEDESESEMSEAEWADLWSVMAPAAARTVEANVWFLHERDAELEIERAKKASKPRRVSRKKPS